MGTIVATPNQSLFLIPMRGSESQITTVQGLHCFLFLIPMRGSEIDEGQQP